MKCANVLQATFDPEVFFNVILPPIIFNAGFSMKKVVFEPHDFRSIFTCISFQSVSAGRF